MSLRARLQCICLVGPLLAPVGVVESPRADANDGHRKAAKPASLQIIARVIQYTPSAMHDYFDDGSFAAYDATRVCILHPHELAGRTLDFYHQEPAELNSPWRARNKILQFEIAEHVLKARSTTLFAGAASKLKIVTPARPKVQSRPNAPAAR